jgi:hypothetical protein
MGSLEKFRVGVRVHVGVRVMILIPEAWIILRLRDIGWIRLEWIKIILIGIIIYNFWRGCSLPGMILSPIISILIFFLDIL